MERENKDSTKKNFNYWLSAFDKVGMPVYITDASTYELLYMNSATRASAGDGIGQKCYQALCNRDAVCPSCTKYGDLDPSGKHSISKEHYNPKSNHYYTVMECLTDWIDGRKARLSIAILNSELHQLKETHHTQSSLYSIQEAIVGSVNMLLFVLDKEGKILFVNDQFQETSKRTLEIGQRMPVESLYIKPDVDAFFEKIFPAVLEGNTFSGEVILLDADKNEIPLRYSSFPVRDDQGNIFAYATIGEDISKEKKSQQIKEHYLRAQEFLAEFSKPFTKPNEFNNVINMGLKQLQVLLHTDRIYFYDIREDDLVITHELISNHEFESKVGLSFPFDVANAVTDELKEKPYLLFNDVRLHYEKYPYFDYGAVSSLYIALTLEGNCLGFINFLTVNEEADWSEEECHLAVTAGSIMAGAIAVHKGEVALKTAVEETKKANLAKSQFLSNVSHEIRTPLNAIIGMAQIVKNSLTDTDSNIALSMDELLSASDHLMSLVNDVLDMSKIEAGKLEVSEEPLDLNVMVQEVINLIHAKANNLGVQFVSEIENMTSYNVLGDKMRLKQVLLNLLGNAVKFTPRDGQVRFCVNEEEHNDLIITRFKVEDTGIGMSKEQLAGLFQPFQQGDNNITRKYGGTGLGLAISQNLVNEMGGEIIVKSELNKGSVFEFSLSFHRTSTLPKQREYQTPVFEDYSGRRVLIVEDIEINRTLIMQLLKDTHIIFDEAVNGEEALKKFKASTPGYYDCILMDIQMPVMNGLEAARQIRSLERSDAKTVVIAAITANAYDEDVRASLEAGMDEHISKPIDLKQFLQFFKQYFN